MHQKLDKTFELQDHVDLVQDIIIINDFHASVQKTRCRLQNKIRALEKRGLRPTDRIGILLEKIIEDEAISKKMIQKIVQYHPMWTCFFSHIKGIGEGLAGELMARIIDIKRFETISSLWAYIGYIGGYIIAECDAKSPHKLIMSSDKVKICSVFKDQEGNKCGANLRVVERVEGKAPSRKTGYHFCFNSKLKTTCFKIAESLIKQKNTNYTKFYYDDKERLARLNPEMSKGHIDMRGKRRMMKILIAHLWEAWKKLEGIDPRPPWATEKQGHSWLQWEEMKQRISEDLANKKETGKPSSE